jgi:hypothetical protein
LSWIDLARIKYRVGSGGPRCSMEICQDQPAHNITPPLSSHHQRNHSKHERLIKMTDHAIRTVSLSMAEATQARAGHARWIRRRPNRNLMHMRTKRKWFASRDGPS